jgi:proteasome lid subunit RPN8/RPN11
MSAIVLTPQQREQIESEGVAAYPNECCGIIFGREVAGRRIVDELAPVANEFETGEQFHRFLITPQTLLKAEKRCTDSRLVLGFYHSHPDAPARPSEYDREHGWPFYSYIIVAIHQRKPVDMTSWTLDEQTEQFSKQDLALVQMSTNVDPGSK